MGEAGGTGTGRLAWPFTYLRKDVEKQYFVLGSELN